MLTKILIVEDEKNLSDVIKESIEDENYDVEQAFDGIEAVLFAKQDQEHIFERFYRAEKSRNRASGGMGLGLPIAYSIIMMHKGTIRTDSEVGKGTKITIKIPTK